LATISRKQRHSLSIDEVNLSIGELYSVVTNKEAKGKKVTIMATQLELKLRQ
jgi:hypothetical protein